MKLVFVNIFLPHSFVCTKSNWIKMEEEKKEFEVGQGVVWFGDKTRTTVLWVGSSLHQNLHHSISQSQLVFDPPARIDFCMQGIHHSGLTLYVIFYIIRGGLIIIIPAYSITHDHDHDQDEASSKLVSAHCKADPRPQCETGGT